MKNMTEQVSNGVTNETGQKLLHGARQVGIVPLPSGALQSHEITHDGMKQVRIKGSPWESAAHFHAARGVATSEEINRVNADGEAAQGRVSTVRRLTSQIIGYCQLK